MQLLILGQHCLLRKKLHFTRIATLCSALLDPWCFTIILAWRFVYGILIWLYVTGWECLPLYVREDCQATRFNPNLSKRGPEDCTLLGWKCWYPSGLVGFFYRILLVSVRYQSLTPQKMGWRLRIYAMRLWLWATEENSFRWHWPIEVKECPLFFSLLVPPLPPCLNIVCNPFQ